MRSKMWHSGRNESARSSGPSTFAKTREAASTFETMLAWLSITPLGRPVVPEV